jgi:4'-phosphopantetheinyl transferase
VKAVGDGLSYPLDAFDVTFGPREPPQLIVHGDSAATDRWVLHAVPVPAGYAAALVTDGPRRVRCRTWRPASGTPFEPEEMYEHR